MRSWPGLLLVVLVLAAGCGGGSVASSPPSAARATFRSMIASAPASTPAPASPLRSRRAAALTRRRAVLRRLARRGVPIFCAGHRGRSLALTFDDGPGPLTRLALAELRRAHARATFFLIADRIGGFPAWPRREEALAAVGTPSPIPICPRSLSPPRRGRSAVGGTPWPARSGTPCSSSARPTGHGRRPSTPSRAGRGWSRCCGTWTRGTPTGRGGGISARSPPKCSTPSIRARSSSCTRTAARPCGPCGSSSPRCGAGTCGR